jgi:hypothetical protein
VRKTILTHPDNARHVFQYADWQFDGHDVAWSALLSMTTKAAHREATMQTI